MRRHLLVALAVGLGLAFTASLARAACDFEHPKSAGKVQGAFVQAFVSCGNTGGNSPNTSNESGSVPTCKPPETYNEQNGNPGSGWRWDETKGKGQVQFTAKNAPLVMPPNNTLNPPGDTRDLAVKLKLKGVADGASSTATGNGFLATVARATLDDRVGGSMTVVDFPVSFPVPLVLGEVSIKTSADAALNALGLSGLPGCTSIEIVDVSVLDENGNTFARMGTYLKEF